MKLFERSIFGANTRKKRSNLGLVVGHVLDSEGLQFNLFRGTQRLFSVKYLFGEAKIDYNFL